MNKPLDFCFSQLFYDGHQQLAVNLASAVKAHPACPPSDRLLKVLKLGLKSEEGEFYLILKNVLYFHWFSSAVNMTDISNSICFGFFLLSSTLFIQIWIKTACQNAGLNMSICQQRVDHFKCIVILKF